MSDAPLIELHNVSKAFDATLVFKDLNLTIQQSEFVVLVGPSGCGKTTLLRAISGLTTANGEIRVGGHTPQEARAQGDFGWVFQDAVLLPWRTARQNIHLPRELLRNREMLNSDDLIGMLGLDGFADALPRELSGGMRSRVAIARALLFRPAVLMMDEPFAALDELTREVLQRDLIRIVRTAGTTVLFVTHSLTEAVLLADRIVVLAQRPTHVKAEITNPYSRDERVGQANLPELRQLATRIREALDQTLVR
jgi:NitT/TauT family transport system ATP-binding protein